MATKSHFCEAMLSIAARCLTASSWPSNQVTSTLNSLPHHSAACLPWAHHVACKPALENAAFSGFSDREVSLAMSAAKAGLKPRPPNNAADALADAAAARMKLRRDGCRGPPLLDIVFLPNSDRIVRSVPLTSAALTAGSGSVRCRGGAFMASIPPRPWQCDIGFSGRNAIHAG